MSENDYPTGMLTHYNEVLKMFTHHSVTSILRLALTVNSVSWYILFRGHLSLLLSKFCLKIMKRDNLTLVRIFSVEYIKIPHLAYNSRSGAIFDFI